VDLEVEITDVSVISGCGDDEEWLPLDEVEDLDYDLFSIRV
jgi:hypothetical protein